MEKDLNQALRWFEVAAEEDSMAAINLQKLRGILGKKCCLFGDFPFYTFALIQISRFFYETEFQGEANFNRRRAKYL